ncbi:hypothetical protein MPH_04591 [Macrophomina phaseolina MS6]|uniref:Uncharacterized protein n=1 Tax=Macrophomina phaseolina (strain MS6) TaxID=1126212 RepID=K2RZR2_MACPH|nr:hypothetical protein MPH_04591 [Macrophomina phaseolina MS6]
MAIDHESPAIVVRGFPPLHDLGGIGEEDQQQVLDPAALLHGLPELGVLELVQEAGEGRLDLRVIVFGHLLLADQHAGQAFVELLHEAMGELCALAVPYQGEVLDEVGNGGGGTVQLLGSGHMLQTASSRLEQVGEVGHAKGKGIGVLRGDGTLAGVG